MIVSHSDGHLVNMSSVLIDSSEVDIILNLLTLRCSRLLMVCLRSLASFGSAYRTSLGVRVVATCWVGGLLHHCSMAAAVVV